LNDGTDLIAALAPVAAVLNQLGVRFYVGGSVASSFHGAARSTMDVDLVCELVAEHVPGAGDQRKTVLLPHHRP